ncbi:hypothetical protein VN97_g7918 [Penicillium thymicola]|uniref:Uncharacterized protein n=1 Tax=Penicillium thymicola TaxID=293382 RepID=A0AAI9TE48_PENTH|nr:hypothetical protein VN97_g7918 [Penicillium thymicola]
MKAVIFLFSVIFVIAVTVAIIWGLAFYKRYRVRLHVTSRGMMIPSQSLDLERLHPAPKPPSHIYGPSSTSHNTPTSH